MIDVSNVEHIYLACGYTDLRKSIDGCTNIVQNNLFLDPFGSSIFIFCNRHKNRIKILEWDKTGFWLYTKRLEGKNRFRWPKPGEDASLQIDKEQLKWFLEGDDINRKRVHREVKVVI